VTISFNAHDGAERQAVLIHQLKQVDVDYKHQRHDPHVNFSQHALSLSRIGVEIDLVSCKQAESFVLAGCLLVDFRFLEGDDMNLPLFGIQVSIPHGKLEISMLTASVSASGNIRLVHGLFGRHGCGIFRIARENALACRRVFLISHELACTLSTYRSRKGEMLHCARAGSFATN
jgi:hypothetical protein